MPDNLPFISDLKDKGGHRVLLDVDLAKLYGIETKAFNQAVKRNAERFPDDFRFPLTEEEATGLRPPSAQEWAEKNIAGFKTVLSTKPVGIHGLG